VQLLSPMRTTCLTHHIDPVFVFDEECKLRSKAARFRFEPRNRLPWDVTVLFKKRIYVYIHIYIFLRFALASQRFFLLNLLIPALGSPLSNRCCRCAGIVLQTGCQVANRVTDVCGESVIHGVISEMSRQRAGCVCVCVCVCALVNVKWFDFNKRGCFL
jgi:hypothetical protein